jgi:cytochrome b
MQSRILVWDFPTRIFHWTLALSFTGAFLTAESERLRDIHLLCGYLVLGLIGFRLVWGIIGSRHARFTAFVRGPAAVLGYLRSLLAGKPEHHVGHNPAGAIAIVLLLGVGLGTGIAGWMTFNDIGGDMLEELHEGLANAMLALVAIHLAGVLVSSAVHRENLVGAMVSGYKYGPKSAGIASRHGIIAILLVAAVAAFGWTLTQGKLPALSGAAVVAAEKADQPGSHHGRKSSREHHD